MLKKSLLIFFGFTFFFLAISSPISVKAYETGGGIVPKCNTGEIIPEHTELVNGQNVIVSAQYKNPCDFNYVMKLVNNVINFLLITLATPLFALILMYVGWLYLSDMGSAENVRKAKHILSNAVIGYVIALAAWIIIKTILVSVGFNPKDAFLTL